MKKRLGYLNKRETEFIRSFAKDLRDKLGEEILCIRLIDCKVRGDFRAESDIGMSVLAKEELLSIRRAKYREAVEVTKLCHTQSP